MAEKIIDFISGKEVNATPEEVEVVQFFAKSLVNDYNYPKELIQTCPQFRVKARHVHLIPLKNILLILPFFQTL